MSDPAATTAEANKGTGPRAPEASNAFVRKALERLRAAFPELPDSTEFRGELSLLVPRERIRAVCSWLKREGRFDMLADLSGVDHYGEEPRFEVIYLLCAVEQGAHLRLKTKLPELDANVDSVTGVWNTANWHERETYDMFGIQFVGHPDLRRILMWPGYPHYPLRKEFPVAGLPASLPVTAEPEAGSVVAAPMVGGPFVASTGSTIRSMGTPGLPATSRREPRVHDNAGEQIDDARRLAPKGKDAP